MIDNTLEWLKWSFKIICRTNTNLCKGEEHNTEEEAVQKALMRSLGSRNSFIMTYWESQKNLPPLLQKPFIRFHFVRIMAWLHISWVKRSFLSHSCSSRCGGGMIRFRAGHCLQLGSVQTGERDCTVEFLHPAAGCMDDSAMLTPMVTIRRFI